jgi:hypothetical protein
MTPSTENPYQSPQTVATEHGNGRLSEPVDWKSVLKRWEILRIPYNLIVGLTGLLALLLIPTPFPPNAIEEAVVYGLLANVIYLLGPVTELYLNWFVDGWGNQIAPTWMVAFVRSRYLTALLFVGGTLFSVALTIVIGLCAAIAIGWPNQQ